MVAELVSQTVERHDVEARDGQWGAFSFEITLGQGDTRFERVDSSTRLHITDREQCERYVDHVMEWMKDPEGSLEMEERHTLWHSDFDAMKYSEEGWGEFLDNILGAILHLDRGERSLTVNVDDEEDYSGVGSVGITRGLLYCEHAVTGQIKWK